MMDYLTNLRPWIDDPSQPRFVRELLEAGRSADAAGYDFEQGFRTHLTRVAMGAPMPNWAEGMRSSASATGASGTTAGSAMIGWLAALVAVTFALMLASRRAEVPSGAPPSAIAVPAQHALQPAPVAAPFAAPVTGASEARAPRESTTNLPARSAPPAEPATHSDKPAEARPAKPATKTPATPKGDKPVGSSASSAKMTEKSASSAAELFEVARPAAAPAHGSTPEQAPEHVAKPEAVAVADGIAPPAGQGSIEAATPDPLPQAAQDDAALEREMMMLAVAQRALASDPARALELARQGEDEFKGSMFTQERQQVLLLALVKLGRLDDAKRLAKPFLARYRQGPFSDRVRRALATGRVER